MLKTKVPKKFLSGVLDVIFKEYITLEFFLCEQSRKYFLFVVKITDVC